MSIIATEMTAERRGTLGIAWLAPLVCLAANLLVLGAVAISQPEYLVDIRRCNNPDARHYVTLGRNLFLRGEYSRCAEAPFVPDVLRTPVYPVFVGALDALGGVAAIYVAQMILQAFSCLLLYHLVLPYFGTATATLSSLLLATDMMLAVSNIEAMSEPLFLFLILASAVYLVPEIIPAENGAPRRWRLIPGSLILGLAILTRPAGLYLPVVYAVLFLCFGRGQRGVLRAAGCSAAVLLLALTPAAAWVVRNSIVFSLNRLTHNDAIMLVYFAGAGAYQVEHGLTLEEAQELISKEFSLPPPDITNNHWLTTLPVAEMDKQLRGAAFPVLFKYPRSLVTSSATAVGKATFAHNVPTLAHAMERKWVAPGAAELIKGDGEAITRLLDNGGFLVSVFIFQTAHNVATCLLALIGVVLVLLEGQVRVVGLSLLVILAYFQLTVSMAGFEATYRSRTPHMPFVFVFAAIAASTIWRRRRDGVRTSCFPFANSNELVPARRD